MTPRKRLASINQQPSERNLLRQHRPEYKLVLFVGLLVLVGLVILFAISPYQIHRINSDGGSIDQGHFMIKQLMYLGVGVLSFAIAAMVPLAFWRSIAAKLLLGGFALSALLAVLGAFQAAPALCFNGACRWYDLGFTSFQPAELLKFGILIFTAVFIGNRIANGTVNNAKDTLWPLVAVVGLAAFFVVGLQKDMGTGITMLGIVGAMVAVAGIKGRALLQAGLLAAGIGVLFIILSPHRVERILTFTGAAGATDASNYHIEMAKVAIGSGGFFGRGLGSGVQAFGYLPEALNDSIFAVLGETFGFLGLLVILGLFVALLRSIIRMVDRLGDPTEQLLVAGTFGWLATHFLVNIGAMTGLFPLTGVTLPFLSFGGTSLLFMMACLGIVYRISRHTQHVLDSNSHGGGVDEATSGRRRLGRTRHASSRRYQRA